MIYECTMYNFNESQSQLSGTEFSYRLGHGASFVFGYILFHLLPLAVTLVDFTHVICLYMKTHFELHKRRRKSVLYETHVGRNVNYRSLLVVRIAPCPIDILGDRFSKQGFHWSYSNPGDHKVLIYCRNTVEYQDLKKPFK